MIASYRVTDDRLITGSTGSFDNETVTVPIQAYPIERGVSASCALQGNSEAGIVLDQCVLDDQITGDCPLIANAAAVARTETEDHTPFDKDREAGDAVDDSDAVGTSDGSIDRQVSKLNHITARGRADIHDDAGGPGSEDTGEVRVAINGYGFSDGDCTEP